MYKLLKPGNGMAVLILALVVAAFAILLLKPSSQPEQIARPGATVTAMDETELSVRKPPSRSAPKQRQQQKRREHQHRQEPKSGATGTANLDLSVIPEADDTWATSPQIEVSGNVMFANGEAAGAVPVVAVRENKPGSVHATARTVSAADGSYRLMVPFQGAQMKLLAQLPGYAVAEEKLRSPAMQADAPTAVREDLVLLPASQLSGKVSDVAGRPVAGAEVSVTATWHDQKDRDNFRVLQNYSTVYTNVRGEFLLDGLPPWVSHVYARKSGYRMDAVKTTAPATSVNLVLETTGAYIKGQVTESTTGRGVSDAFVILGEFTGETYPKIVRYECDSNGYYSAGPIAGGRYLANAEADGYVPIGGQKVLPIEDGVTSTGVDFVMYTGHTVSGKVLILETGEPVAGAMVYARYAVNPRGEFAFTVSGADGAYRLKNIEPLGSNIYITAEAPNLRTYQDNPGMHGTWLQVPVSAEQLNRMKDIRMIGEAYVSGIVRKQTGEPAAHAEIRAEGAEDNLAMNGATNVTTLTDGSFTLPVAAPAERFQVRAIQNEASGMTEPVSLLPGEEILVEISIPKSAEWPVPVGVVTPAPGMKVTGDSQMPGQIQ